MDTSMIFNAQLPQNIIALSGGCRIDGHGCMLLDQRIPHTYFSELARWASRSVVVDQ